VVRPRRGGRPGHRDHRELPGGLPGGGRGGARAGRTLRGITGLEVVDKRVKVERGLITEYRVEMKVIFLLE
jgi:hypothetical protein